MGCGCTAVTADYCIRLGYKSNLQKFRIKKIMQRTCRGMKCNNHIFPLAICEENSRKHRMNCVHKSIYRRQCWYSLVLACDEYNVFSLFRLRILAKQANTEVVSKLGGDNLIIMPIHSLLYRFLMWKNVNEASTILFAHHIV